MPDFFSFDSSNFTIFRIVYFVPWLNILRISEYRLCQSRNNNTRQECKNNILNNHLMLCLSYVKSSSCFSWVLPCVSIIFLKPWVYSSFHFSKRFPVPHGFEKSRFICKCKSICLRDFWRVWKTIFVSRLKLWWTHLFFINNPFLTLALKIV